MWFGDRFMYLKRNYYKWRLLRYIMYRYTRGKRRRNRMRYACSLRKFDKKVLKKKYGFFIYRRKSPLDKKEEEFDVL